jgi:hypothetical protein
VGVLTAAAVLHEFTSAQLAVWCEEDVDTVAELLAGAGNLFTRLPTAADSGVAQRRWRVNDPQALRRVIKAESQAVVARPPGRVRAAGSPVGLAARLRMAEETLMDCAEEPTASGRRIMADSATNYLRQVLADVLPEPRPWWELDPALVETMPEYVETGAGVVTRSRVRADLALARLTTAAATGVPVEEDFLLRTAEGLTQPFGSSDPDQEWLRRLSGRFAELALCAIRPAGHDTGNAAPARLLSALTWRRTLADARGDVREAVRRLARVLPGVVTARPAVIPEGDPMCLFQVVDHLPHGRERINVYAPLLEILPRQLPYREERHVLPGVLVTAVTEPQTSNRLRMYADAIEDDLLQSNFTSGSALIGQTAHVVQHLAVAGASMDDTVLERSDRARRDLLALAGVPA